MTPGPAFVDSPIVASERPIAVVTGATGGIGRWIALGMARAGHHVILVGRDHARGTATMSWIDRQVPWASSELLIADLSLVSETRDAGRDIAARYSRISVLINNAGVFEPRPIATAEGHDRVLATNLLCPFVLTRVLLPLLLAGAPSRIVNVGSSTSDHARIDPDNLVLGRHWAMQRAYSQSKLALMMTTFRLANDLKGTGVVANVVHPGLVATGLVRTGGVIGLVWRALALAALTEEQGAATPLHAALAPDLASVSGLYLKDRRVAPPNPRALNPDLLDRVWQATERLI
jgi:NAD(P)-dependent dehydrogenase (short-subunit alcohol dehydrogenase family)